LAFSAKYRIKTISDIYGIVTADFEKEGYAGSVTEFDGVAPNPIALQIGANSDNLFRPVLPSVCEVVFYMPEDFGSLELATDAPLTWRLSLYDGSSNIIWRGWVDPEQYQEAYTAVPYVVSVFASDGLEYLKAFEFEIKEGRATLFEQLIEALTPSGIALPFRESINIYDTLMDDGAADSPLVQATALYRSYQAIAEQPNCFEVLEAILAPFGARIFQWAGHWYVENITQKTATYTQRTYNSSGAYQSNASINPVVVLDKGEPDFRQFIEQSGQLTTQPPIRIAKVFFKTIAPAADTTISGFANASDWTNSTTLANWTKVNSPVISRESNTRSFDGVVDEFTLLISEAQSSLSNNKHIISQGIALTASTFDALRLSFWYNMFWPTNTLFGGKPIFYTQVQLSTGVDNYFWRGEWIKNQSVHIRIDPSNRNEWKKFETTISAIPEDGELRIRLFTLVRSSGTGTAIQIGGFRLTLAEQAELDTVFEIDLGAIAGNSTFNPYELEVFLADGPNISRPGALETSGVPTSEWNRKGKTDGISLKRLLIKQFISMYQRPTIKVQGTLKQIGLHVAPFHVIADNASISTRKYVMQQYTLGMNDGSGAIAYREIIDGDATVIFQQQISKTPPVQVTWPVRTDPQQPSDNQQLPSEGTFDFDLLGDVSGEPGTNVLNPSAIVEKPLLDYTGLSSDEIAINAVPDTPDAEGMTKTTITDLFTQWTTKATPIALDRIVISDSEDDEKLKVVTGVPLTMLGQGGAISGQAIVWDGAKWAAATVEGSKWTEVTNGIYRNGRVAIGTTTVGTSFNLDVAGKIRFKHTTFDSQLFIRDIGSGSGFGAYAAGAITLQRTGGVLDNQGVAFLFQGNEGANDFYGAIGGIKTSTATGNVILQSFVSGTAGINLEVTSAGGVLIQRKTGTDLNTRPSTEANSLQVAARLLTGNFTGTTARYWKLGERKAATTTLDTTQYITVEVNGVVYNLALATV
jgi:hypothetical protein